MHSKYSIRRAIKHALGDQGALLYRKVATIYISIAELLLRPLFYLANSLIILEYDDTKKTDGVGAQLQRILGISALSSRYGFSYKSSKISNLAIHPLDPYKTQQELITFLDGLNAKFKIPSRGKYQDFNKHVQINALSLSKLAQVSIEAIFTRKRILLSVVEPYPVLEIDPNFYLLAILQLTNYFQLQTSTKNEDSKLKIVIHHRYGVGGMAVQKGELTPREMPINYFKECISYIVNKHGVENISSIHVLTDAPRINLEFTPPDGQADLWENSPKFIDEKLQITGSNLDELFVFKGIPTNITSGGDPLAAIDEMATADYLIMSRSSLSYVGALLNRNGTVIYPALFWHKPLTTWLQNIS
jgi:hypothetical protein